MMQRRRLDRGAVQGPRRELVESGCEGRGRGRVVRGPTEARSCHVYTAKGIRPGVRKGEAGGEIERSLL